MMVINLLGLLRKLISLVDTTVLPPNKKFYNCIKECDLGHTSKSNSMFVLLNAKITRKVLVSSGIDLWQLFPHTCHSPNCNPHL